MLNLFGILPPGQLFRVSIHFGALEYLDTQLLLDELESESGLKRENSLCNSKNIGTSLQCISKRIVEEIQDIHGNRTSKIYQQKRKPTICACFEVKHHHHQPTIFHHHHQRHSICCRTRQLIATSSDNNQRKANINNGLNETELNQQQQFDQHFTFFERFYYTDSPITCLSIMNSTGKKLYKFKCHLSEYVNCRSVNQYFSLQNKKTGQYCRLQFSIVVKPIGGVNISNIEDHNGF